VKSESFSVSFKLGGFQTRFSKFQEWIVRILFCHQILKFLSFI
jgi:hypothetical protein